MDDDNLYEELMRLTQLLVVEGARVAGAFASRNGLNPTDVDALTRVLVAQERDEPLTAGVLAAQLGLTSGAVTFVVDRLERAGHLCRVRDVVDRRRVYLHYSANGRALAEEFFAPTRERARALMAQFTADELDVVRRFMDATVDDMADQRAFWSREAGGAVAGPDPTTSG